MTNDATRSVELIIEDAKKRQQAAGKVTTQEEDPHQIIGPDQPIHEYGQEPVREYIMEPPKPFAPITEFDADVFADLGEPTVESDEELTDLINEKVNPF